MGFRNGQMEQDMKGGGFKARQKDMGNFSILMAIFTKDSFPMTSNMDKESTFMQTEPNTQENG